uniref:ATP synthase complex subunit 8 n=1 Tax=Caenis robusta TaxID=446426 RepID=A0A7D6W5S0_9INSE|nr:ATP synthase F0 subunit 8 [Caenis robusta]UJG45452.1 ATP synthase F0 subunit 8 [Caenis robusta]
MPQMAPISWLTLFILFSVLYIMYMILNYFSSAPTPNPVKKNSNTHDTNSFFWKW